MFFDDDLRNISVCEGIGVIGCHVNKEEGLTREIFLTGLRKYQFQQMSQSSSCSTSTIYPSHLSYPSQSTKRMRYDDSPNTKEEKTNEIINEQISLSLPSHIRRKCLSFTQHQQQQPLQQQQQCYNDQNDVISHEIEEIEA